MTRSFCEPFYIHYVYFLAKFVLPCKITYSLFCVLFLVSKIVSKHPFTRGRIKGFVGPRQFTSLGPFGDSKSIVGTTVYSRLSGLMEGEGMHG
jgi:hypothetical protein